MQCIDEKLVACPYCGEKINALIAFEDIGQTYVEDCEVCCRPIVFKVSEDEKGESDVHVYAEDEVCSFS